MAGDYIGENHLVVVRDLYEGKPHSTVTVRFLHAVEIGPNHPTLDENGLLLGYLDNHLMDFIFVQFFLAVDKYAGDSNISGFSLYGPLVCNNCNRPSHWDSGVSPFLNTVRQF
jgi:hypothetical protein